MHESASSHAQPPRRWFRFTLRTFFILLTLTCVTAGWYINRCEIQRRTVFELAALDISIHIENDSGGSGLQLDSRPNSSSQQLYAYFFQRPTLAVLEEPRSFTDEDVHWLSNLPGLRMIHQRVGRSRNRPRPDRLTEAGINQLVRSCDLRTLELHGVGLSEQNLEEIGKAEQLSALLLYDCQLPPRGLLPLSRMKLQVIRLTGSRFDPDTLSVLNSFERLQILSLGDTNLGDANLGHLISCHMLTYVTLADNQLTDDGLVTFLNKGSRVLRELDVSGNRVGDRWLSQLANHPDLMELNIADTAVSDDGLEALHQLPNLERLRADNTSISDQGMLTLGRHPKLSGLFLQGTKLTDAGLSALEPLSGRYSLRIIFPAEGVSVAAANSFAARTKADVDVRLKN